MKNITYYSFNGKEEKLGPGPWQDEPDKLQWEDEETGYPCIAKRNPMGTWCGYVGVHHGHPAYLKYSDDVDVRVHGGLTYSNKCSNVHNAFIGGICHQVEDGEDDDVWWLGFDCGHGSDIIPALLQRELSEWRLRDGWPGSVFEDCEYRDLKYVKKEIVSLAKQLRGMEENEGRQDSKSVQRESGT